MTGGVNFSGATEIVVDQSSYVNITDEYEKRFFSFTPESTGFYSIKSYGIISGNPEGYLYNDGEQCLAIGDDIEPDLDDYNFGITYHLREDVTYYLAAGCCEDGIGSYYISISEETTSFYNNLYLRRAVLGNSYSFPASLEYEVHYYLLYSSESIEALLFSSDKISDPCVWIYNSSFSLVASNDDGAGNLNFRATLSLVDHQKYYVVIGNYEDEIGSFKFNTAKDPNLATAVYYIKNVGTSYYMAIQGQTAETFVNQEQLDGVSEQKWTITRHNDGYYSIQSEYGSNKYLGVTSNAVGLNNVQLSAVLSDSTKWKLYKTREGNIVFEPKNAIGKTLYAPNLLSGTILQLEQLCIYGSIANLKSVFYITQGFGEQDYIELLESELSDYRCLQYSLKCLPESEINNWDVNFSDYYYPLFWQIVPDPCFFDENSSSYAQVRQELAENSKDDFETLIEGLSQFSCICETQFYGNGDYRPLDTNQYRVVLRTGIHLMQTAYGLKPCADYHFWYQTKDGSWANKHGEGPTEHLNSGVTPFSVVTSGWNLGDYSNFYDSQIYCFIITVN